MARAQFIGIRETLTSFLPGALLERLARESGMVQRRRKVDPLALLWTLALGFSTGGERTLAGLRRVYQRVTGTSLVPSAFYDRFTPELVGFLRRVVGEVAKRLAEFLRGLLPQAANQIVVAGTVAEQGFSGVPVRRTTYVNGRVDAVAEIKEVRREAIPASVFEVPAGFKREDPMRK